MKRLASFLSILMCVFSFSIKASSQYYFYDNDYYDGPVNLELGFSAGGMNCLTDLGGRKGTGKKFIKDINWNATRFYGSLYAGVTYNCIIAARLEFSLGQITASDKFLKNDGSASYGRLMRNLSFRSGIAEASLLLELHPLAIINLSPALSPYILSGIGYFRFSPQAFVNNSWIMLSALHTEGQGFLEYKDRKPYKLTQLNMPAGCGLKYEVSATVTCRFEVVYRKLWTDYLDDVSKAYIDESLFDRYLSSPEAALARKLSDRRLPSGPDSMPKPGSKRGNDKDNDAYFSFAIKAALVLGRTKRT